MNRHLTPGKGSTPMSRSKSPKRNARHASTAQIIFLVLTVVIILSFVLSLFLQV